MHLWYKNTFSWTFKEFKIDAPSYSAKLHDHLIVVQQLFCPVPLSSRYVATIRLKPKELLVNDHMFVRFGGLGRCIINITNSFQQSPTIKLKRHPILLNCKFNPFDVQHPRCHSLISNIFLGFTSSDRSYVI